MRHDEALYLLLLHMDFEREGAIYVVVGNMGPRNAIYSATPVIWRGFERHFLFRYAFFVSALCIHGFQVFFFVFLFFFAVSLSFSNNSKKFCVPNGALMVPRNNPKSAS